MMRKEPRFDWGARILRKAGVAKAVSGMRDVGVDSVVETDMHRGFGTLVLWDTNIGRPSSGNWLNEPFPPKRKCRLGRTPLVSAGGRPSTVQGYTPSHILARV